MFDGGHILILLFQRVTENIRQLIGTQQKKGYIDRLFLFSADAEQVNNYSQQLKDALP